MSIAAINVAPNFLLFPRIDAPDLARLQDPQVYREHHGFDSDGVSYYCYTVGGFLDGKPIAHCTVGGDVIIITEDSRETADYMAVLGLEETITTLRLEADRQFDAMAAKARLQSVGPLDRLALATRADADKSDAFEADMAKIRTLVGDDIVLAQGH